MEALEKEDFCNYSENYESVWWPHLRKFRVYTDAKRKHKRSKFIRVLHSVKDYVVYDICKNWLFNFDAFGSWDKDVFASFPRAFRAILNNIFIFLTPWYRIRRKFINGFINCNDSKLLDCNFCSAYVRNREQDCAYYRLTFTGFHYKLVKTVLRDGEGKASNRFVVGLCTAFSNKSDEEKKKELDSYQEEHTKICSGWVFGWNSAVYELNKIACLTPDLEWFSKKNLKMDDNQTDLRGILFKWEPLLKWLTMKSVKLDDGKNNENQEYKQPVS